MNPSSARDSLFPKGISLLLESIPRTPPKVFAMAQSALLPVTLTCNTDLRFIDLIQVVGSEFLKHLNFTQEDGERLWLAIQEGIANAMRHGNKLAKDKSVKVTFTPLPDRFEIRIEDQGAGVDLAS